MCVGGGEGLGGGLGVLLVYCVSVCDCMNAYVQVSVCTSLQKRWAGVCEYVQTLAHARVWQ